MQSCARSASDRSHLNTASAAFVAKIRGRDVILAFGTQEGERAETLADRRASARAPKPLKQLLQHQPSYSIPSRFIFL